MIFSGWLGSCSVMAEKRVISPPGGTSEGPGAPVVRAGAHFEGLLVLPAASRIEGRVEGEIIAAGPLWIGPKAQIQARVEADEVVVGGHVVGTVEARSRIQLLATARVRGELVTPRLSLAEGCVFEGRCRTHDFGPSETLSSP
jgi:cytoskeletal protein CcmA (bactofilin family)